MTDAELIEHLQKLDEAATPGPWRVDEGTIIMTDAPPYARCAAETFGIRKDETSQKQSEAFAALIAETRNALPRLLELARKGHAKIEWTESYGDLHADRDRLLAALKAEAIAKWDKATRSWDRERISHDWPYAVRVCGLLFHVTRGPDGELTADEVVDV